MLLVAPPSNMFKEGLLVPFMSWKHVGAVVDAKNRHLICIFQILKKLHTHIHTPLSLYTLYRSPSLCRCSVMHIGAHTHLNT